MAQKKQNTPAQEGTPSVGANRKKVPSTSAKTSKTARERAKSRFEKTNAPGRAKMTSRTEKPKVAKVVKSKVPSAKKTATKKAKPSKTMALRKNAPRKVSSRKEMVTEALRSELRRPGKPHLVLVVQNDVPQNAQADVIDDVKNDTSENGVASKSKVKQTQAATHPLKSNTHKTSAKPETSEISTNSEATKPSLNQEKKTAATEEANTLYILGIRYSTGRDVAQNLVAAHKWFNLAVMMGHDEARECRADIAREMTSKQIAQAQKEARVWLQNRRNKSASETNPGTAVVKRPMYVRRHAQAMRSAKSFARTCACA
jgi:TPR repeat protein